MEEKANCWEIKECGRGLGGSKVKELGLCPAAADTSANGINHGINGGRTCWAIVGSFAGGKVHGTFARKLPSCRMCEVFIRVMAEDGVFDQLLRTTRPVLPSPRAPRPRLEERPLIGRTAAAEVAGMFQLLANGTRLRLLHALARTGEMCISDLAEAVGTKPQIVSNRLRELVDRGVLGHRVHGHLMYYQIVDPCVTTLLDHGLCVTVDAERPKRLVHSPTHRASLPPD